MASLNVLQEIITPLQNWFDREIPSGKAEIYDEVLKNYSSPVLKYAMGALKRQWSQQSMPQPAVIKTLCEEAALRVRENNQELGELNFGERPNGKCCSCSKHYGIGSGTPEQRAKTYAWFRDKRPQDYKNNHRKFLESFEEAHGKITSYLYQ